MSNIKKLIPLVMGVLCVYISKAQMPHDALYMPKNTVCAGLSYSNDAWKSYWEGALKVENFNIGTHTTQSLAFMAAYGLSDKFNVIANLPYIQTQNSAGNLLGQKGLQDASLWLKYKLLDIKGFSMNGIIGGSLPMSNYVPDFLPMSIGIQSKTLTGRLLLNYIHTSGLYLTSHGGYTHRSNIAIDRDGYLANGKIYNTNEVYVPNMLNYAARIGILKQKFQTEVFIDHFEGLSGDDIRRNDMPFPTNKMVGTNIGWYGKIQPKQLGAIASVSKTLNGRNIGQSVAYSVGIIWQMSFIPTKEAVKE